MGPSLGEGDNKHLEAILLLLHTGTKRFKNVKFSYLANGVDAREHKNSWNLPHNTLPYECKVCAVTYKTIQSECHLAPRPHSRV